jgi:hypothetical protein
MEKLSKDYDSPLITFWIGRSVTTHHTQEEMS